MADFNPNLDFSAIFIIINYYYIGLSPFKELLGNPISISVGPRLDTPFFQGTFS
jgi:hypothetical protein